MAKLPYKVSDISTVPEAARALYEQQGDEYVLQVDGVEPQESIGELKRALERTREENRKLKGQSGRVSDDDLKELEDLRKERAKREEEKAKLEGRWEDLRSKLLQEKDAAVKAVQDQLSARDRVIEQLTVTNELRSAISKAGFQPEYAEAVEALLGKRGPKVVWDGETPKGVIPDELHGDQAISDFVAKFAKSDAAKPYLPNPQKSGGGAPGTEGKGGGSDLSGKKYGEMTPDEKIAFTQQKYATQAGAA